MKNNIKIPSNRKFGFFFTIVFLILFFYFLSKQSQYLIITFLILSVLFFIVTIIKADLLLPLNKLWMKIGLILGKIISPIVLGLIFFIIFTPIGIITRLFGRDELNLKTVSNKSSWRIRQNNFTATDFLNKQY
tara:strand:+ start:285 stop:683 length:399 start_codon:yes stop_codon:yes gene_type:complete